MMKKIAIFGALALSAAAITYATESTTVPAEKPLIDLKAYVPCTVLHPRYGHSLPVVLEVTNPTNRNFRIFDYPNVEKATENNKASLKSLAGFPNSPKQPFTLYVMVQSVYPTFTALSGYDVNGPYHPHYTPCPPGQTVLLKTNAREEIFQAGHCRLQVTLYYMDGKEQCNVAYSQLIDLQVVETKKATK